MMRRLATVAMVLALLGVARLAAANGSLKVTSFPSGGEVLVDGVSTAKVTPMSGR